MCCPRPGLLSRWLTGRNSRKSPDFTTAIAICRTSSQNRPCRSRQQDQSTRLKKRNDVPRSARRPTLRLVESKRASNRVRKDFDQSLCVVQPDRGKRRSAVPCRTTPWRHAFGNRRARRVLVEAAWSYRHPARVSETLRTRLEALPKAVRDIA